MVVLVLVLVWHLGWDFVFLVLVLVSLVSLVVVALTQAVWGRKTTHVFVKLAKRRRRFPTPNRFRV